MVCKALYALLQPEQCLTWGWFTLKAVTHHEWNLLAQRDPDYRSVAVLTSTVALRQHESGHSNTTLVISTAGFRLACDNTRNMLTLHTCTLIELCCYCLPY